MSEITRDDIIHLLRTGSIVVTFTKADGTVREMRCTTRDVIIGSPHHEVTSAKPNETIIRAFDLDKQAWRSFRVESVISVEVAGEFRV